MSASIIRATHRQAQLFTARHLSLSSNRNKIHRDESKINEELWDAWKREAGGTEKEYVRILQRENPMKRCAKIMKNDFKYFAHKLKEFAGFPGEMPYELKSQYFATHCEMVILGGGMIGTSIAYWMSKRAPNRLSIIVIENEEEINNTNAYIPPGVLRQQFSLPENVQMSLFCGEFLQDLGDLCEVEGAPRPTAEFYPCGHLVLAGQDDAEAMAENMKIQQQIGVRNILLTPEKIKEKFPWIDTTGVEVGCLGLEKEGFFNSTAVLNAMKMKSINNGVEYVQGRVIGFEFATQNAITVPGDEAYEQLERVVFVLPNGQPHAIKFGFLAIADEMKSQAFTKMARIGYGKGLLCTPSPISLKDRNEYVYYNPSGVGLDTPVVVDPSGVYFRRTEIPDHLIAGFTFPQEDEALQKDFEADLRNLLIKRVPKFNDMVLKDKLPGKYEYNELDENGILGFHPMYHNCILALGFSANGAQHAPAVGRAVMEILLDGKYVNIDLSRFTFERVCVAEPLVEDRSLLGC